MLHCHVYTYLFSNCFSRQIDANKKRDAEIARLWLEIEMLKVTFDAQSDQLKKKCVAGTTELLEQIDQISRLKNRADKERAALQKQLEMGQSNLDGEA